MLTTLLTLAALAAPPSSTLTGDEGTLSWQVQTTGKGLTITGSSPKWTVVHTADASLKPQRTVHTEADGTRIVIDYTSTGATLSKAGTSRQIKGKDLWDGDALDVRLGANVAAGRTELAFSGLDPASGKVYSFDTAKVGDEQCSAAPCTHVRVQLTGWLRHLGPTWHYWYTANGKLVRFEGPAGNFASR